MPHVNLKAAVPASTASVSAGVMIMVLILASAGSAEVPGSAPPSLFPEEEPLHLTVASTAGERFGTAIVDAWLPPGPAPIRYVVIHQHGCGDKTAQAAAAMVYDRQWRALCRLHHSALVVPRYFTGSSCADWNAPAAGSERVLLKALEEIARQTGRPEVRSAPWVIWGHSGGASWAVQMVVRHPGRTVALALRGGASSQFGDRQFREQFAQAVSTLPMIFVWGAAEARPSSRHFVSWNPMQAMAAQLRQGGARLGVAVDPLSEHQAGNSRLVILPFFSAVMAAAREMGAEPSGRYVHRDGSERAPSPSSRHDPEFMWLPNSTVVESYRSFVKRGTVREVGPPKRGPELRAAIRDGRPMLQWRIVPEVDSGVRSIRIYRDQRLIQELGSGTGRFLAEYGDTPPPAILSDTFVDPTATPGECYDYAVSFVSWIGIESPRSAVVRLLLPKRLHYSP